MRIVSTEESGIPATLPVADDCTFLTNNHVVLFNPHPNQQLDRTDRELGITLLSGRHIAVVSDEATVALTPSLYLPQAGQSDTNKPTATAQLTCSIVGETQEITDALRKRLYRAVRLTLEDTNQSASGSQALVKNNGDVIDGLKPVDDFCRGVADRFCATDANPTDGEAIGSWNESATYFRILDNANPDDLPEYQQQLGQYRLPASAAFPYLPDGVIVSDLSTCVVVKDLDG